MDRVSDLFAMQSELQAAHPEWGGYSPEQGQSQLLWMLGEVGEVIDIVKRNPPELCAAMGDVHEHLVEELVDTMMYLLEVMQCYNITPKEFTNGFAKKHNYNMGRDFASENKWV